MQNREERIRQIVQEVSQIYRAGFSEQPPFPRSVGIEEEYLLVDPQTGEAGSTAEFFTSLESYGFEEYFKDGSFAGVILPWGILTTDAGLATLELSSSHYFSLHELSYTKEQVEELIVEVAREAGFVIYGAGILPLTRPTREFWQKNERYALIVRRFSPNVDKMCITAATQVQVGIGREEIIPITFLMNLISGVFVGLSANSPVWLGREDSRCAPRQGFWYEFCERGRVDILEAVADFRSQDTLERYLAHLLSQELFLYRKGGKYYFNSTPCIDFILQNEPEFNELRGILAIHEGSNWPPARPRHVYGTIEVRPCCQQPQGVGIALPAFIVGLIENWPAVLEYATSHSLEEWKEALFLGIKDGLKGRVGREPFVSVIKTLLNYSEAGLKKRGQGEEKYLKPLEERVKTNTSPADLQRQIFRKDGVYGLIRNFSYR